MQRFIAEAAGRRGQKDIGHKILKHRARPGDSARISSARHKQAAHAAPIFGRHYAPSDGIIDRRASLGHKEIVAAAAPLARCGVNADGEELLALVAEYLQLCRSLKPLYAGYQLAETRAFARIFTQPLSESHKAAEEISAVDK